MKSAYLDGVFKGYIVNAMKKGEKVTTIGALAEVIQREFLAFRSEMATKSDMERGFVEVHHRIDALENKFDALEQTLGEILKMMREDRREHLLELEELKHRIERLEKKVGLS